jgi:hypothetical protein
MKKLLVILVVLLLAANVNVALAQDPGIVTSSKPGWHKIGETTASFKAENESIIVLGADKFKSIKLKITEAPVNIQSLQVFYEDGAMEEINVANEIKAGGETREIDLKNGMSKELKKVVFTYKTLPNRNDDRAHVELYGLK